VGLACILYGTNDSSAVEAGDAMSITTAQLVAELEEMDVDYLVDVLGISSDEILDAFPLKVQAYIKAWEGDAIEDDVGDGSGFVYP